MRRISALAVVVLGGTLVGACSSPGADDSGSGGVSGTGGSGASASGGGTATGGNLGAGGTGGTVSPTGTGGTARGGTGGPAGLGGSSGAGGSVSASGGTVGSGGTGMGTGGSANTGGSTGAQVSVDATGKYTVTFAHPAWTFAGTLGAPATAVMTTAGSDAVGAYHETTFSYSNAGTRNGRIRAYDQLPVVVFGETNPASASNIRNFPVLSTLPTTAYHVAHDDIEFAPYTMSGLTADSPWTFFDANANAFIVSAGSHFTNAQTTRSSSGAISVGIDAKLTTLPAGFEQTAVLAVDAGINQTHDDWGTALRRLGGKKPIPNDATPDLAKFGYWTDNYATYYYKTQSGADYQTTLKNVAKYYQQLGAPIGYIQLDSWWYPKGAANSWQKSGTDGGGEYLYQGDSTLFPNGLAAFQQSLGLPLITHARWIDTASPYRSMYKMSNNVSIDPAFWSKIASSLKSSGVVTYEQDWLNINALPSTSNLTDQDAFTDNMAQAMAAAGLSIQYCMALPRYYLQASKYQNLVTARASEDGFARGRWRNFFYTARLAWSMGLWPWTDVFMSSQHDNLLLSTLTGGMMGVGDAINGADKASIMRAIRADGVLIKPDVPILLTDKTIVAEAQGKTNPSMATTYSEHTGGRTTYVFGFTSSSASLSFTPAELGYSGSVYVYDVNKQSGRLLTAMQANADTISDTAYYVVAPVGQSGIAFLGEQGKIAPLGSKRISDWSDNGTLSVSVAFAAGETSVTLTGYAASAPTATADTGTVGAVQYDATSKRFTLSVSPAGSSASLKLHI
ncbi:MAG: hypothetical protein ACJ8F1_20620 [Polyangia bacterium]